MNKEVVELTARLRDVEAEIRLKSPHYASLTQPKTVTLSEIRSTVLDAETALFEYVLGEERSFLWVVTPTDIKSFQLPKRSILENQVRRVISLARDGVGLTRGGRSEGEYAAASWELSRALFSPELAARLMVKRLLIVGDGALQFLPFGAGVSLKRRLNNFTS